MPNAPGPDGPVIRFGVFELDPHAGELRKGGRRIWLRPQAARVLQILADRSAQVVTRAELKSRIWGADTFVDFEHGLNLCIHQIREALNDDAGTPRFIETLPRRGYRFIAPLVIGSAGPAQHSAIKSLAVLPFENFGGDPADDYLADGMTEALINELASIAALRVISRTSAMSYKGARKALRVIAGELNVDAVIEGSMQRFGKRLRTTVQLLDARLETHLWSANYDHDFGDILKLQCEVACAVTEQTKVKLTERERMRRLPRPVEADTFEAYLKGRYYANKVTGDGLRKAIAYFERAIARSGDFAPAYAGLADCYIEFGVLPHGGTPPKEVFPLAMAAATTALQLDPTLAEAHVAAAMIKWRYAWDWPAAEREFQRAIELSPGSAGAHQRYAWYLFSLARHDEAIARTVRALRADPLSVWIHATLGLAFYYARQYDRAIEQLTEALDMDPHFGPTHTFLAWTFEQKRMFDEAVAEFHQGPLAPSSRAYLAHTYAVAGRITEARATLEALIELARHCYVPSSCVAPVYAALGDIDEAFAWLEKACDERDGWLVYVNVDPRLNGLHSDVRFQSLLRRIGLDSTPA